MRKKEIITAFCNLSFKVSAERFHFLLTSDCFCEDSKNQKIRHAAFFYDEQVFEYIASAVREKIARDKIEEIVSSPVKFTA